MPEFEVKAATIKKTFPSKDGKGMTQVFALKLAGSDGEADAELMVFPGTSEPKVGETIEGTLQPNPPYAPNFLRARKGGFGGARKEDPKKAAHIARMHAQDMAVQFARLLHDLGKLDQSFNRDVLTKLIDWFQRDAEAARDRA